MFLIIFHILTILLFIFINFRIYFEKTQDADIISLMEPLDIERNLRALQGIYPGEIQDKPHPLPTEHIKGLPIWMRENLRMGQ